MYQERRHGISSGANGREHELRAFGKADRTQEAHLVHARPSDHLPDRHLHPVTRASTVSNCAPSSIRRRRVSAVLNMFTGGALSRMGVFALGIMPYISASIIVQLMAAMVPAMEQLKKEGEQGRKKLNQYTRYGTVALATAQAYGLAVSMESGGLVTDPGWFFRAACVITLVGGTMFLMWLGEQITGARHRQRHLADHLRRHRRRLPRAIAQTLELGRTGAMAPA
jgi:hypothetical protein